MSRTDSVEALDKTLQLRDGRTLGYAEYGITSGKALLYFGGSRLEARFLAKPAKQAGIRLIGIDRPGIGLSHFKDGRRLLDWPNNMVELADSLQIDHFAIVGVSGVGPLAVFLFQRLPWLLTPMMWVMGRFFRDEEQARKSLLRFTQHWPEPDRKSLLLPEISELWAASLVEAFRQGARGLTYDTLLGEGRPWGFKLEELAFPALQKRTMSS